MSDPIPAVSKTLFCSEEPLPSTSDPPVIEVVPVNVLACESVSVPAPALTRPPVLEPPSADANVTFCPLVSIATADPLPAILAE